MTDSPAFFRRRCCSECGTVTDSGEATVVCGDLTLDRSLKKVWWRGEPVRVTAQQFGILDLLVHREGRVVQPWAFYTSVLKEDSSEILLKVQMSRLRKLFRSADPDFTQIQTVRGEGVMWRRQCADEESLNY